MASMLTQIRSASSARLSDFQPQVPNASSDTYSGKQDEPRHAAHQPDCPLFSISQRLQPLCAFGLSQCMLFAKVSACPSTSSSVRPRFITFTTAALLSDRQEYTAVSTATVRRLRLEPLFQPLLPCVHLFSSRTPGCTKARCARSLRAWHEPRYPCEHRPSGRSSP